MDIYYKRRPLSLERVSSDNQLGDSLQAHLYSGNLESGVSILNMRGIICRHLAIFYQMI